MPKERSFRPIGPSRKLVFDDEMSSYSGPLNVALSLLTSSWITLDLQAHQELLKVIMMVALIQPCVISVFKHRQFIYRWNKFVNKTTMQENKAFHPQEICLC